MQLYGAIIRMTPNNSTGEFMAPYIAFLILFIRIRSLYKYENGFVSIYLRLVFIVICVFCFLFRSL